MRESLQRLCRLDSVVMQCEKGHRLLENYISANFGQHLLSYQSNHQAYYSHQNRMNAKNSRGYHQITRRLKSIQILIPKPPSSKSRPETVFFTKTRRSLWEECNYMHVDYWYHLDLMDFIEFWNQTGLLIGISQTKERHSKFIQLDGVSD